MKVPCCIGPLVFANQQLQERQQRVEVLLAGCCWLDSALLMSCQQEEEYQLPDAGMRLVSYRQLAVMPFRSLTDVDYHHW